MSEELINKNLDPVLNSQQENKNNSEELKEIILIKEKEIEDLKLEKENFY